MQSLSFINCHFGRLPIIFGSKENEIYEILYPHSDINLVSFNTKAIPDWLIKLMNEFFDQKSNYTQKINLEILKGTPFQKQIWKSLLQIPFGKTVSYSELAMLAGFPRAHRAVGTAVGKNPLPFLIPCHRVIKSDGHIGNFRGGQALKEKLLLWEQNL